MTKIALKYSFGSLHFQWLFEFLEKMLICVENVSPVKKLQINDGESFLELIFDLSRICKLLFKWNI